MKRKAYYIALSPHPVTGKTRYVPAGGGWGATQDFQSARLFNTRGHANLSARWRRRHRDAAVVHEAEVIAK